MMVVLISTT